MNDLKQQLRVFITETFLFGVEEPFADSDSLMDNGIVDSTGVLELIEFLEERFGLQINE
jgi:acyl carrier protein